MTLAPAIREQVRQRAGFACEFCGVTETDAGGLLTVDHFQPRNKGGDDTLGNLVYCCVCCNLYKAAYWPAGAQEPALWNPRREPAAFHFVELDNGLLHPLTSVTAFTAGRLRLNRLPLVAWRLQRHRRAEERRLLRHYRDLVNLLEPLRREQAELLKEQQRLLSEQRALLRLLLGER